MKVELRTVLDGDEPGLIQGEVAGILRQLVVLLRAFKMELQGVDPLEPKLGEAALVQPDAALDGWFTAREALLGLNHMESPSGREPMRLVVR